MGGAANFTAASRIFETGEEAIKACVLIPPDQDDVAQRSGCAVGVAFHHQHRAAGSQPYVRSSFALASVREKLRSLSLLAGIPIAREGFEQLFNLRSRLHICLSDLRYLRTDHGWKRHQRQGYQ